ncbi:MAG: hypothetical protein FD138_481 [Planctomycetota bacterium]|nr:MAG: hypothetical protein FD138_481 [Planctomycetota bacterium]
MQCRSRFHKRATAISYSGLIVTAIALGCGGCSSTHPISGELFVTSKSGDVKKAAGLPLLIIKVTPEIRELVFHVANMSSSIMAAEQRDEQREKTLAFTARQSLEKLRSDQSRISLKTDSEGRFSVNLARGEYIILSEQRELLDVKIVWATVFSCDGKQDRAVLDEESAIISFPLHRALGLSNPLFGVNDKPTDISAEQIHSRLSYGL